MFQLVSATCNFIALEIYQKLVSEMHHLSAYPFVLTLNYLFYCYFSPISAAIIIMP